MARVGIGTALARRVVVTRRACGAVVKKQPASARPPSRIDAGRPRVDRPRDEWGEAHTARGIARIHPPPDLPARYGPKRAVLAGDAAQNYPPLEQVWGWGVDAAAKTSRGPTMRDQGVEYSKNRNEDGVVIRLIPGDEAANRPELTAIFAFDQAGGVGTDPSKGTASRMAAYYIDQAVDEIDARGDYSEAEVTRILREACEKASAELQRKTRDRWGEPLMTTIAGAVVLSRPWLGGGADAYVLNCGDSRVVAVAPDGEVRKRTREHGAGGGITRALGYRGADTPEIEHWKLDRGDRIACFSDGIGNGYRDLDDLGALLAQCESPGEAISRMFSRVLDRMSKLGGRTALQSPDNMTAAVALVR